MKKVGYFADGPWAHRALDLLVARNDLKIVFICGRYDKTDDLLKLMAFKRKIPFLSHPSVNSSEFISQIQTYSCDLFVSMSFNQIFRKQLIEIPTLGTINCHAGKLPFYRGRNVLNWVLINDEREFGVTVHFVDEGVDTGDIIRQECFPISDTDTYGTILERAYDACAALLNQSISDLFNKAVLRKRQDDIHPLGLYCTARGVGDEKLNWNQPSRQVFNFVRAISFPGPVARCFKGGAEVKISRVDFLPDAPSYLGIPGAILAKDGGGLLVKTSDNYVRLVDWQSDVTLKVGDRLS